LHKIYFDLANTIYHYRTVTVPWLGTTVYYEQIHRAKPWSLTATKVKTSFIHRTLNLPGLAEFSP